MKEYTLNEYQCYFDPKIDDIKMVVTSSGGWHIDEKSNQLWSLHNQEKILKCEYAGVIDDVGHFAHVAFLYFETTDDWNVEKYKNDIKLRKAMYSKLYRSLDKTIEILKNCQLACDTQIEDINDELKDLK